MPPLYWALLGAELLACAAIWLPGPTFDRFMQTKPGRLFGWGWDLIRWGGRD